MHFVSRGNYVEIVRTRDCVGVSTPLDMLQASDILLPNVCLYHGPLTVYDVASFYVYDQKIVCACCNIVYQLVEPKFL